MTRTENHIATRIYSLIVFFTCFLMYAGSTPAHAYNWPWDQGHDCVQAVDGWGVWGSDGTWSGSVSSKECCELLCKACPVYANTGQLQKTFTDLTVPGIGPSVNITRTYNSQDWATTMLGNGWTFNFGRKLIISRTQDGEKRIGVVLDTGEKNFFKENLDGSIERITDYGVKYSLVKNSDNTYTILNNNGTTHELREDGKISRIIDRNLNALIFSYNSVGCISRITNASGNYVDFVLGPNGKIASISDNLGRTITYGYDDNGNLVSVADPMGNTTQYTYNSNNLLTQFIDARGNVTETVNYDTNQPPRVSTFNEKGETFTMAYFDGYTQKTDSHGNRWTYYYNDLGIIERVVDPLGNEKIQHHNKITSTSLDWEEDLNGNRTTYTYDEYGNMTSKTDPLGNTTIYTYVAGTDLVESETNPLGVVTRYEYDANGNRTRIVADAGGHLENVTAFTYDRAGNQISVTDPLVNTTTYEYDTDGNLTKKTDPLGNITTFTYDSRGNRLTETDANGNTTTYSYDLMDRLISIIGALGGTTTYAYDANGNKLSDTDANGNRKTFAFDAFNRMTTETNALGNVTAYSYDSMDNLVSNTDARGNTTAYTFDIAKRLLQETNPLGGQTKYTYDAAGNQVAVTDAKGNTSTFTYDATNRKVSEKNAAGETTSYSYDALGNMVGQTIPTGNTISRAYDALNRLASVSDTLGLIKSYQYNLADMVTEEKDALENTTQYRYDAGNRLVQTIDPMGNTTSYAYDSDGNVLSITDREGHVVRYTYDALGRKISQTDQLGLVTTFTYDQNGNLLSIIDANGNATIYAFDAANRLVTETYADGLSRSFSYDPIGNLISRIDQEGNETRYSFDAMNRVVTVDYPGANDNHYSYGATGNLVTAANQNATVTFTYDNVYRMLQTDQDGEVISYSYDSANNIRTITAPSGKTVKEKHDQRDQLTWVEEGASAQLAVQYTYDSTGRVQTKTYGNGISATYTWNANGWVTDLVYKNHNSTLVTDFHHGFDREGNRLFAKKSNVPGDSEQYLYDAKYRLVQFKRGVPVADGTIPAPTKETVYNLDGLGNWESMINDGVSETRNHNAVNEITEIDGMPLAHSPNGNLTEDGSKQYQYDFDNRLVRVIRKTDGAVLVEYNYDAIGRRIHKSSSGMVTDYYYDKDRVVAEKVDGVFSKDFVYGRDLDEIVLMESNEGKYFYLANTLGSTVALTDGAGNVVEEYLYEAYGQPLASSAYENTYLFTGRQYDEESGLQYNRNRYLSYNLGRWITRDPLGYVDGMSRYEYVRSNPVNFVDPYGLWGSDVHLTRTLTWATQSGIIQQIASIIARADNDTDSGSTGPWPWAPRIGGRSRHFDIPLGGADSRNGHANTDFNSAVQICKNNPIVHRADAENAFRLLGRGLHSLQDLYAHRDWDNDNHPWTPHPGWYDDWNDNRNVAASQNTTTSSTGYLTNFINSVANTCCEVYMTNNQQSNSQQLCCDN